MSDVQAEPELISRTCVKCGVEDTEPHHVQYVAFNHPVTGTGVDLSVTKHVTCCAEDGCLICTADVDRATQDGADLSHLRDWLTNRPREHYQYLFEHLGIESVEFQYPANPEEE